MTGKINDKILGILLLINELKLESTITSVWEKTNFLDTFIFGKKKPKDKRKERDFQLSGFRFINKTT
ncbi:hypothetical protein J2Z60_002176 [Lactobacillus colini]|uniref:Transposase n=1 Tax=Lactobacillus colini TaxID=1819254 RepID=A0ABS4MGZ6_9LACO|nr:hypothetical protein [Lactobacillus colini]MBP2058975.1 hypothetical protein [Lactobacillus colini]